MSKKSPVVYDSVTVELRDRHSKKGPFTIEEMKELLGWTSEADGDVEFGKDYLFRDLEGNKIRLGNNETNRPFRMTLAKRYMLEILRGKWALNGETITVDKRGGMQSGQHRGVGFILAEQERKKNVGHWKEYGWKGPVNLECIIVKGIDDSDDVTNTIDLGQKRSLGDVIFRSHDFGELHDKEQKKMSNVLANALRLCWLRVGGKLVSDAPHFPHSEALDFLEKHPRIREAVEFVTTEEGGNGAEGKKISNFVTLGYAAGLMYLMATAKTDPEEFKVKGPEAINFDLWDKAVKFWQLFASGAGLEAGDPLLIVRNLLMRMDASGASSRDEICGCIINAFNAWIDKKKGLKATDIKVKKAKNEDGKMVLVETPRIGGLDTDQTPDEEEEEEVEEEGDEEESEDGEEAPKKPRGKKKAAKKPAAKGGKKKWPTESTIGEWVWVVDPDGNHWKGKLKELNEDSVVVTAEDKKDYAVDLTNIVADKPE